MVESEKVSHLVRSHRLQVLAGAAGIGGELRFGIEVDIAFNDLAEETGLSAMVIARARAVSSCREGDCQGLGAAKIGAADKADHVLVGG